MPFSASQRSGGQGEIILASFVRQLVTCLLAVAPIYFTLLYTSGVLHTYNHDNFRENCDWGCREHLPELPEGCQLNLLLVGKRGHGKSALGNYILGQDTLHSQQATGGLIRNAVSSAFNRVGERQILVVDVAGVDIPSGPDFDEENPLMEAVSVEPGGYHAIIIVISTVVNITEEDKAALLYLPSLFGERFFKYAIFVFTHCDIYARRNSLMESSSGQAVSAHFLPTLDPEIKHILKMSEDRYFFVDNMDRNMFNQRLLLFGLIETVDTLVDRNKGSNYTNDDFKAAREEIYRKQKQLADEAERARQKQLAEEAGWARQKQLAEEAERARQKQLAEEAERARQKQLAEEAERARQKQLAEEAKRARQKQLAEEAGRARQKQLAEEAERARQKQLAEEAGRARQNSWQKKRNGRGKNSWQKKRNGPSKNSWQKKRNGRGKNSWQKKRNGPGKKQLAEEAERARQKQLAEEAKRARPRTFAKEAEWAKPFRLAIFLTLVVGVIITIIAVCCL